MSSPFVLGSSKNARFDTHHLQSQPEEVCNANIASYRASKASPKQTLFVSHSVSPKYPHDVHQALVTTKLSKQSLDDSRVGSKLGC